MGTDKKCGDNRCGNVNTLLMLLGGAIAGSALALLLAPQSGKQTRRDIRKLGMQALTSAERFRSELRDHVDELISTVVTTSSQSLEKGKALTDKIRGEVLGTLENGRKMLEEEIGKVQQRFR